MAKARELIGKLPRDNYRLLRALVLFLTEVVGESTANKMTAHNLALVFGPNLCWSKESQVSLAHLQHLNGFALVLITHYEPIFGAPAL